MIQDPLEAIRPDLRDGEEILWTGRYEPEPEKWHDNLRRIVLGSFFFLLPFALVAPTFITGHRQHWIMYVLAVIASPLALFGLLAIIIGPNRRSIPYERTLYAITTQRVISVTHLPRRVLESVEITETLKIEKSERRTLQFYDVDPPVWSERKMGNLDKFSKSLHFFSESGQEEAMAVFTEHKRKLFGD